MINPSAPAWIDKFFLEHRDLSASFGDSDIFYKKIRLTGFIYGHIIRVETSFPINSEQWLRDEISKMALLNALYEVYALTTGARNPTQFISDTVAFYDNVHPAGFGLLKKILPAHSESHNLEKIIDDRVQTNGNIISKNFSHIVTNALLFIDVLAFRRFLANGSISEKYLRKMEEAIISIVALALKAKSDKSVHDDLLIKLFEASVRYSKFSQVGIRDLESLQLEYFDDKLEKYYLLDMAGLSLWSDGMVEKEEAYFLHSLARIMNISEAFVTESILETNRFITRYKMEIPYFNYSNPVKHFYDQTTKLVVTLIKRNKKRLANEISESKELMVLLAHSTKRDLDKSEKKKVKKQLLDICKSIPSLTIFLIPGGSLLLPILIKFIPQMLPSSFNENLNNE